MVVVVVVVVDTLVALVEGFAVCFSGFLALFCERVLECDLRLASLCVFCLFSS